MFVFLNDKNWNILSFYKKYSFKKCKRFHHFPLYFQPFKVFPSPPFQTSKQNINIRFNSHLQFVDDTLLMGSRVGRMPELWGLFSSSLKLCRVWRLIFTWVCWLVLILMILGWSMQLLFCLVKLSVYLFYT